MSASIRFLTHGPEREEITLAIKDAQKLAQIARKNAAIIYRDGKYLSILCSHICEGDVMLETCYPITDNSLIAQYEQSVTLNLM